MPAGNRSAYIRAAGTGSQTVPSPIRHGAGLDGTKTRSGRSTRTLYELPPKKATQIPPLPGSLDAVPEPLGASTGIGLLEALRADFATGDAGAGLRSSI
jgi:hypothetical protein